MSSFRNWEKKVLAKPGAVERVTAIEDEFRVVEDRPGKVGRKHPATAKKAALNVAPRTGTQRWKILNFVQNMGAYGATDDEMIVGLGMLHQSVGPRRLELVEGGFLVDSGATRKTRTGQDAIVWIIAN